MRIELVPPGVDWERKPNQGLKGSLNILLLIAIGVAGLKNVASTDFFSLIVLCSSASGSAKTNDGSICKLVHTLEADSGVPIDTAIRLVLGRVGQEFRVRRNSWQKGHPKDRRRHNEVGRLGLWV